MVQALAASDYTVIAIARQETPELAAAREQAPGAIYFVPFDLIQTADIHEFVRTVRERFGPVYGLVNNAGLGTEGILATMPESSIEKLVQLNTLAPIILICRAQHDERRCRAHRQHFLDHGEHWV